MTFALASRGWKSVSQHWMEASEMASRSHSFSPSREQPILERRTDFRVSVCEPAVFRMGKLYTE
jgi:hypothetical protein